MNTATYTNYIAIHLPVNSLIQMAKMDSAYYYVRAPFNQPSL